jgi:hypothetical protein
VVHTTVRFYEEMRRHYYITPSSYLELIKLYKVMLEEKTDKINKKKERISNGLQVIFIDLTLMEICDINIYLRAVIHPLQVDFNKIFYKIYIL